MRSFFYKIHNREKIKEVKIMKKNILICLLILLTIVVNAKGCSYTIKDGLEYISLDNNGYGWIEISNKNPYCIEILNAQKPQFTYQLPPYGRRSLNWSGKRQIKCRMPEQPLAGCAPTIREVNCSEVIDIVQCQPESVREKYNDLDLVK